MCSEDSCTPNNPCYVCWAYGEGDPNHVPPDSKRVDSVQEMGSFSDVNNQVHYDPPLVSNTPGQNHQMSSVSGSQLPLEQQRIMSLTDFEQDLHVVQPVYTREMPALQLQQQNRSIQDESVGVYRSTLEKQSMHSTSAVLPKLQTQIGGSQGPLGAYQESGIPMFMQQHSWYKQQIQLLMQASRTNAQMYLLEQDQKMLMQQRQPQMGAPEQCLSQQQVYVPGTCAKRLAQYMHMHREMSNGSDIECWRKFVIEFFAPLAKKRWCFSLCQEGFKKTAAVTQRMWHCQICNLDPGCGYEAIVEVLPGLFNIKYESGVVQELLYVDMPSEYLKRTGDIVLDYEKAIAQTVYESLRIVRDGRLRIVFTPDLKIRSWDFCIRNIEQLIPGRTIVPQIQQLKFLTWKYQLAAQNVPSNVHAEELNKCSHMLIEAACGFPNSLEVPGLTDMGYTKKYVRGLEISEVLECMGDLIDYSIKWGMSPRMSLAVLGSSSRQCGGPNLDKNPNKKQKREPIQHEQADNYNVASENVHIFNSGGVWDMNNNYTNFLSSPFARSSSQIPFTKSSATPPVAQVDDSSSLAAATATAALAAAAALLSSLGNPESSSSN